MSKFLREEDISMGFRAPLYSVPVCIPEYLTRNAMSVFTVMDRANAKS